MQADRVDITRTRGDTVPEVFQILLTDTDDAAISLTGYTFALTVDTLQSPTDALTNVVTIAGSIIDEPDSHVEFDGAWDTVPAGDLFYEIQSTDPGGDVGTTTRGRLTIKQDIVKA